jgi:hypothetical protein
MSEELGQIEDDPIDGGKSHPAIPPRRGSWHGARFTVLRRFVVVFGSYALYGKGQKPTGG